MQESSYQRKVVLISIWFRMVLTQTITWVYKDSLTLTHPPTIKKIDWHYTFDTGRFFDAVTDFNC